MAREDGKIITVCWPPDASYAMIAEALASAIGDERLVLEVAKLLDGRAPPILITASPRAQFVILDKALNDALTALNTHNRGLKDAQITAFRKEIRNGEVVEINQGLGVTASGYLSDGQNRLKAHQLEGYPPIPMLLVTGLSDKAQTKTDQHARRSQADIVRLALNTPVSATAIAALNTRHIFATKQAKDRLSSDQLAEQFAEFGEAMHEIIAALKQYRTAPVVASLLDYGLRAGRDRALDLARQIGTGELLEMDDPAYRARQFLEKRRRGLTNTAGGWRSAVEIYRRMISVCVAHYTNARLTLLKETVDWPTRRGMPRQDEIERAAAATKPAETRMDWRGGAPTN